MQEINIKLWRHSEEQDWSAEVHGTLHEHISTRTLDDMVEYVLVAAQQALLESEVPPGATPTDLLPMRQRPLRGLARAGKSGIHKVDLAPRRRTRQSI